MHAALPLLLLTACCCGLLFQAAECGRPPSSPREPRKSPAAAVRRDGDAEEAPPHQRGAGTRGGTTTRPVDMDGGAVGVGSHARAGQAGGVAEEERRAEAAGAQVGAADSGCSRGGGGARRHRHGRSRGVVPLVQRAHAPLPAVEALVCNQGTRLGGNSVPGFQLESFHASLLTLILVPP